MTVIICFLLFFFILFLKFKGLNFLFLFNIMLLNPSVSSKVWFYGALQLMINPGIHEHNVLIVDHGLHTEVGVGFPVCTTCKGWSKRFINIPTQSSLLVLLGGGNFHKQDIDFEEKTENFCNSSHDCPAAISLQQFVVMSQKWDNSSLSSQMYSANICSWVQYCLLCKYKWMSSSGCCQSFCGKLALICNNNK